MLHVSRGSLAQGRAAVTNLSGAQLSIARGIPPTPISPGPV
jgi:hypothetical protein